jgi:hypothetical protein
MLPKACEIKPTAAIALYTGFYRCHNSILVENIHGWYAIKLKIYRDGDAIKLIHHINIFY